MAIQDNHFSSDKKSNGRLKDLFYMKGGEAVKQHGKYKKG